MRAYELFEKANLRTWAGIQQDAAERGLRLYQAYGKQWRLTVDAELREQVLQKLESYGIQRWNTDIRLDFPVTISTYQKIATDLSQVVAGVDDWAKNKREELRYAAYNNIERHMFNVNRKNYKYQLHIPNKEFRKTAALSKYQQGQRRGSWKYQYDDEGNLKETVTRPRLNPSSRGGNKPSGSFWTSTVTNFIKSDGKNYVTSEWNDWVLGNQDDWWSPVGELFRVKPTAKILDIRDTRDAKEICLNYLMIGDEIITPEIYHKIHDSQEYYDFSQYFPWDLITSRVDGIHSWGRQGYGYDNDSWSYSYDVESTAWFNMDALEYVGKVRISKQRGSGYDDY
jgi:hypothetical protein